LGQGFHRINGAVDEGYRSSDNAIALVPSELDQRMPGRVRENVEWVRLMGILVQSIYFIKRDRWSID